MRRTSGFTLVELSIAILIIGLLIGGVMLGQTLLRSAQIRSALSEYALYTQAIGTFRDKYMALPGDYSAATTTWGAAGTCPASAAITSGTCNGDGNGLIVVNQSGTRIDEQFLAWHHLRKAELIQDAVSGYQGSVGTRDRVPGVNVPRSKLNTAGWGLISVTLSDLGGGYTQLPYTAPDTPPNHVLWLGGRSQSGTVDSTVAVLTTSEALDIDKKADDGIPTTGKILSQSAGSCISAGAYNSTAAGLLCALVFKTGY
jgi:prepilin-type N-terminal cleavage/methylation domain-containing protein